MECGGGWWTADGAWAGVDTALRDARRRTDQTQTEIRIFSAFFIALLVLQRCSKQRGTRNTLKQQAGYARVKIILPIWFCFEFERLVRFFTASAQASNTAFSSH